MRGLIRPVEGPSSTVGGHRYDNGAAIEDRSYCARSSESKPPLAGGSLNGAHLIDSLVEMVAARVTENITKTGVAVPRLLSVPQAAIYLGRTEDAVRRLQVAGTLRAVKLDGRVQFDRSDLDQLIENSKV